MSFLDHIRHANNWNPGEFLPFAVAGRLVGHVRRDRLDRLRGFPDTFVIGPDQVSLAPRLDDFALRTAAMGEVVQVLRREGEFPGWRGEAFPVMAEWGDEPLLQAERVTTPWFGVRCWGVHVNGYVRRADGLHMWIARRAGGKSTYPDMLDNLVAGGQPVGLGLMENVIKECQEEAAIPRELAARARAVGTISYCHQFEWGFKPDQQFCYDLELPEDFTPRNLDGEVQSFALLPITEVARIVGDSFEFKFNCNLVIIDFLIRHGLIDAETEPDYVALCMGLHRQR